MKVLFIGHYKDNTNWSNAGLSTILSMDAAGIDVVCRNISIEHSFPLNIPKRVLELEKKNISQATHCIQHVLPHKLCYTEKFTKNIAMQMPVGVGYEKNIFQRYLSLFNEILVPFGASPLFSELFIDKKKIHEINFLPPSINLEGEKFVKEINFGSDESKYKFYSTYAAGQTDCVEETIKCFFRAFERHHNVVLYIAITKDNDEKKYEEVVAAAKKKINKYENPSFYPSVRFMMNADRDPYFMNSMRRSCDCFVNLSSNEVFPFESLEAIRNGKALICNEDPMHSKIVSNQNYKLAALNPCVLSIGKVNDTIGSTVYEPDFVYKPSQKFVCDKMKYFAENINKSNSGGFGLNYDYKKNGMLIKEILSE